MNNQPLVNSLTAYSAKDKYHPALAKHLDTLRIMGKAADLKGLTNDDLDYWPSWNEAMGLVTPYGPEGSGVYSFPVFSKSYCADLLIEAQALEFIPADHEDPAVRIPEVTLEDRSPDLYRCLLSLYNWLVQPMGLILLNVEPNRMASIQFARYSPEDTAHGHWHTDGSSDVTLVVALNDDHVGGGTEVKPCGFGDPFEVEQLPVGHGMFFKGKTTLHQGLPVLSGYRHLLVFWCNVA